MKTIFSVSCFLFLVFKITENNKKKNMITNGPLIVTFSCQHFVLFCLHFKAYIPFSILIQTKGPVHNLRKKRFYYEMKQQRWWTTANWPWEGFLSLSCSCDHFTSFNPIVASLTLPPCVEIQMKMTRILTHKAHPRFWWFNHVFDQIPIYRPSSMKLLTSLIHLMNKEMVSFLLIWVSKIRPLILLFRTHFLALTRAVQVTSFSIKVGFLFVCLVL